MIIAEAYLPDSKSRSFSLQLSRNLVRKMPHLKKGSFAKSSDIQQCHLFTIHTHFLLDRWKGRGLVSLNKKKRKNSKNAAVETQAGGRLREESQFSHTVLLLLSHEWKTELQDYPYLPQVLGYISVYRPFRTPLWELSVDRLVSLFSFLGILCCNGHCLDFEA